MHQCLLVTELLISILERLIETYRDRAAVTSDLLHVALTCRAFLDPGLDKLWEKQDSLIPILRILPNTLVQGELGEIFPADAWPVHIPIALRVKRQPKPSDWSRFTLYARRVKQLRFSVNLWWPAKELPSDWDIFTFYARKLGTKRPSALIRLWRTKSDHAKYCSAQTCEYHLDDVMALLAGHRRDESGTLGGILPNLEQLYVTSITATSLLFVHLFLGPSLNKLDLSLNENPDTFRTANNRVLSILSTNAPNLKDLRVRADTGFASSDPLTTRTAWDTIATLENLSSIDILVLATTCDILPSLAGFQHLTSLKIYLVSSSHEFLELKGPPQSFPVLESFDLTVMGPLSLWDSIAHLISAAPLQKLILRLESPWASDNSARCIENCFRNFRFLSRTLAYAKIQFAAILDIFHEPLSCRALWPLWDFEELRVLNIQCCFPIIMNDHLFPDRSLRMRHLYRLNLDDSFVQEGQPVLSLQDLLIVVRCCPRLHTLGINIDTSVHYQIPIPDVEDGIPHEHLKALLLGRYYSGPEAEDVPHVARFLSTVFPNLRKCVSRRFPRWSEVEAALHSYAGGSE